MTQTTIPKGGAPHGNKNAFKHGGRDADARRQDHEDHQLYCECRQLLCAIEAGLKKAAPQ